MPTLPQSVSNALSGFYSMRNYQYSSSSGLHASKQHDSAPFKATRSITVQPQLSEHQLSIPMSLNYYPNPYLGA